MTAYMRNDVSDSDIMIWWYALGNFLQNSLVHFQIAGSGFPSLLVTLSLHKIWLQPVLRLCGPPLADEFSSGKQSLQSQDKANLQSVCDHHHYLHAQWRDGDGT